MKKAPESSAEQRPPERGGSALVGGRGSKALPWLKSKSFQKAFKRGCIHVLYIHIYIYMCVCKNCIYIYAVYIQLYVYVCIRVNLSFCICVACTNKWIYTSIDGFRQRENYDCISTYLHICCKYVYVHARRYTLNSGSVAFGARASAEAKFVRKANLLELRGK